VTDKDRERALKAQQERLLTVKEYAFVTRQHPLSVYRRIREGRQPGVHHVGGNIRLNPPEHDPPV
jgi:hypothetical protein